MSELDTNMKAARMLGLEAFDQNGECGVTISDPLTTYRIFNLFTDDTDLMNVVVMLGEKYDIVPVSPLGHGTHNWSTIKRTSGSNKKAVEYNKAMPWFDSYREAVSAGIEAVDE